jgi:hypothetical protein
VNAAPDTFIVPIDRTRVESIQRESFGFNLPDFSRLLPSLSFNGGDEEAPDVSSLELQVERIAGRADGGATFIMSNGQIWSQVDPQRVYNVRVGDTVTIRRAAMGSFMLIGTRGGSSHRVRREN